MTPNGSKLRNLAIGVLAISGVAGLFLVFRGVPIHEDPDPSSEVHALSAPGAVNTQQPSDLADSAGPLHNEVSRPRQTTSSMSEQQFDELASQILRELPTRAELAHLTDEETHGTPEPVARAGELLGRIAQVLEDHPELKPRSVSFYSRCAKDGNLLTSARALCYSHVLDQPSLASPSEVPEPIRKLARMIPRSANPGSSHEPKASHRHESRDRRR